MWTRSFLLFHKNLSMASMSRCINLRISTHFNPWLLAMKFYIKRISKRRWAWSTHRGSMSIKGPILIFWAWMGGQRQVHLSKYHWEFQTCPSSWEHIWWVLTGHSPWRSVPEWWLPCLIYKSLLCLLSGKKWALQPDCPSVRQWVSGQNRVQKCEMVRAHPVLAWWSLLTNYELPLPLSSNLCLSIWVHPCLRKQTRYQ
jgi:hypothetical protein